MRDTPPAEYNQQTEKPIFTWNQEAFVLYHFEVDSSSKNRCDLDSTRVCVSENFGPGIKFIKNVPSLKLTLPLKNGGLETAFRLGHPMFRTMLVSFREGKTNHHFHCICWVSDFETA